MRLLINMRAMETQLAAKNPSAMDYPSTSYRYLTCVMIVVLSFADVCPISFLLSLVEIDIEVYDMLLQERLTK